MKMTMTEYLLSHGTPLIEDSLRKRMEYSMPHSTIGGKGSVLDTLSRDLIPLNVVIHEAVLVVGQPKHRVETMNYCVTFLDKKDAEPMLLYHKIWISGKAMNGVISHKLMKTKFVYDGTMALKEGWTVRGNVESIM